MATPIRSLFCNAALFAALSTACPLVPLPCPFFGVLYSGSGEGNGTSLQYSCLENPMDGGAWRAAVHGVAEGWTRLSNFIFIFYLHALEKEMATYSSVLAWRQCSCQGQKSLVGCRLWGHTESDTTEVLAAAAARCFLTSYFCIPLPYNEKDIFFGC